MDLWQHLKADNLGVSFIQVLPNLKSCQGTKPKSPTSYTINCVMFMCLRVSAPGICWYTLVGESRGKEYNREGKRKKTGCSLSGNCPGAQNSPWCLVGPAPAPLLAASVVMCGFDGGRRQGMVGPLSSLYCDPATSLLRSVARNNSPFSGEAFELMIWCLFNKGILIC